jgi:uncharacterized protein with LGFP repeats
LILEPMCDGSQRAPADLRVESSIFASPRTGAHFVIGEIRRLYLQQGGVARLGYPLTDEVPTPDGMGLMTRFERGAVFWYPGRAAEIGEPVLPALHDKSIARGRAPGPSVASAMP